MSMSSPWRLDYPSADPYPGSALEFGTWSTHLLMTKMPKQDPADTVLDDAARARADGLEFGEDFLGASNIVISGLEVSTSNETEARDVLDGFRRAWRADAVRRTPGALAVLTAHTGRVAFGRPRKPSSDDERMHLGRSTIDAEFLAVTDLWYGDEESAEVTLAPALGGGVVGPVVAPVIVNSGTTDRSRGFTVGGELPTWVSVRISGPIASPSIEIPGRFRFGFDTTLAYDEWIDVAFSPTGRVTVLRNGVQNIATDGRSDLLSRALLAPGSYSLVLRGQATSGTPTALATWRKAYPHW